MTNRPASDRDLSIAELIALGRDREAAIAATRADGPARGQHRHSDGTDTERGEPMDGVQQLDEIIPLVGRLVDQISPDQLHQPSPCANFTVGGVLEHMIAGASAFAPAFRGVSGTPTAPADGTLHEQWRAAMDELLAAVHSPGAQERTIAAPFGEMPGAAFARFVAFDGLVHGWDLATATGQAYDPPVQVVTEVDEFTRTVLQPAMRDGDTFAAETSAPAGATPLERLVAFSGRRLPTTKEMAP